jgi:hypothetical protein
MNYNSCRGRSNENLCISHAIEALWKKEGQGEKTIWVFWVSPPPSILMYLFCRFKKISPCVWPNSGYWCCLFLTLRISLLASLFSVVCNCKILLFLLTKVNDKIKIIIRHLSPKPAQILWYSNKIYYLGCLENQNLCKKKTTTKFNSSYIPAGGCTCGPYQAPELDWEPD